MDEDYGCYDDYGQDDYNEWETEQVFQDREHEPDEFGDFGIDGMGPDGE